MFQFTLTRASALPLPPIAAASAQNYAHGEPCRRNFGRPRVIIYRKADLLNTTRRPLHIMRRVVRAIPVYTMCIPVRTRFKNIYRT